MRCRRVRELLPIYEDGGLPARTLDGIEEHLADCSECRQEASELDDALSVLRAVPKVRPAPEFKRAVIAAVRRESVRTRQGLLERVLVWQPAFATAGVAACILIGAAAILQHGKQTPPVTPVAEQPAVEIRMADNPPEPSPTRVTVVPERRVKPRVEVVANRPSRRIEVAAVPRSAPVAAPARAKPAPERVEAETPARAAATGAAVSFDILGVGVLIADISLSDVTLSDEDEAAHGFMLASARDEVGPAALEGPAGATNTKTDPTTL